MAQKIVNGICLAIVVGLSGYAIVDGSFTWSLFLGLCLLAGFLWLCCLPFILLGNLAKGAAGAINRKNEQRRP